MKGGLGGGESRGRKKFSLAGLECSVREDTRKRGTRELAERSRTLWNEGGWQGGKELLKDGRDKITFCEVLVRGIKNGRGHIKGVEVGA